MVYQIHQILISSGQFPPLFRGSQPPAPKVYRIELHRSVDDPPGRRMAGAVKRWRFSWEHRVKDYGKPWENPWKTAINGGFYRKNIGNFHYKWTLNGKNHPMIEICSGVKEQNNVDLSLSGFRVDTFIGSWSSRMGLKAILQFFLLRYRSWHLFRSMRVWTLIHDVFFWTTKDVRACGLKLSLKWLEVGDLPIPVLSLTVTTLCWILRSIIDSHGKD